jgi:hypothetical protein
MLDRPLATNSSNEHSHRQLVGIREALHSGPCNAIMAANSSQHRTRLFVWATTCMVFRRVLAMAGPFDNPDPAIAAASPPCPSWLCREGLLLQPDYVAVARFVLRRRPVLPASSKVVYMYLLVDTWVGRVKRRLGLLLLARQSPSLVTMPCSNANSWRPRVKIGGPSGQCGSPCCPRTRRRVHGLLCHVVCCSHGATPLAAAQAILQASHCFHLSRTERSMALGDHSGLARNNRAGGQPVWWGRASVFANEGFAEPEGGPAKASGGTPGVRDPATGWRPSRVKLLLACWRERRTGRGPEVSTL